MKKRIKDALQRIELLHAGEVYLLMLLAFALGFILGTHA
jgi:hypothetical protein